MRPYLLGLAPAILVALVTNSEGVTQVRYETWSGSGVVAHDVVAPPDTVSFVGVDFDATSTAGDLVGGFHFAIAERDPGVDQVLARLEIPCLAAAPVGSEINVTLSLALYCDRNGNLHQMQGIAVVDLLKR